MLAYPRPTDYPTIVQAVQRLQGQFVLQSAVEDPTSHIFTLWFGLTLAADQLVETGALNVHCAWRTEEAGKILCAWQQSIDRYTEPALQTLVGLQVATVTPSEYGDLHLSFTSGRTLHIWNDIPYEEGDSWLLGFPGQGEYAVASPNEFTYCPDNRQVGLTPPPAA
ncbi:MAG: hypothetical protein ACRYFX_17030 [Janthinobacterium lividum]